ncbi:hypothetical protein DTO217A2_2005 [Paecilomyces variotii]|nr:hypothetical protein DTO217A2_2005 [Paecilomyces variotii]
MSQKDDKSYFETPFYGCAACAAGISTVDDIRREKLKVNLKRHQCDYTECGWCDADEIDEACFSTVLMWSTFFRAIIPAWKQGNYRISGIAQGLESLAVVEVPWERNACIVGDDMCSTYYSVELNPISLLDDPPVERKDETSWCYLIHARCWKLLEGMIGPQAKEQLPSLVSALRQKFKSLSFGLDGYTTSLSGCSMCVHPLRNRSYMRDPLRLRSVQKLIAEAIRRRSAKSLKPKEVTRATVRPRSFRDDLPMEIKYLIIENTREIDTANLIAAFDWFIPDSYWVARLPFDLIPELQQIPLDQLDMSYLGAGIAYLLARTPDMRNRARTVGILKETTQMFWKIIEDARVDKASVEEALGR